MAGAQRFFIGIDDLGRARGPNAALSFQGDSADATDVAATVAAKQQDLHTDVIVVTRLPHAILRHRLNLLVGAHWTLRDVKGA